MIKYTTILILLSSLGFAACGQTETEVLKKANSLIVDKKYESAFKLLDSFDPKNKKPDVVLLKEDIVLNYFVTSIMHQMFALKDLQKNENILDYRGKKGSFYMQKFQVDSILENLIKVYPTNCKLYKGLGAYYYEVYNKYNGQWLKEDGELLKLMQTNFQKAVEGNCADYLSYYILGFINVSQEKYKESIPYFLKSIELNKNYADAPYNLAYAYLYTEDRPNALKYAKVSLDLYTDQTYKSDAARMLGQIYTEMEDNNNALVYFTLADKIDPGNYYNIKLLLDLYVKTGNKDLDQTVKRFFNLDPTNPTIYKDLEEIYYTYKKQNDLIDFYKSQLLVSKDNDKVQGNLNFFLGKIYIDSDKKLAKEYFLKAKEIFGKVYKSDHQVFVAINEGLKQCEK